MAEKLNKQAERSRQWLADALFELLKEKPLDKIQVRELCEKAGVARLTFYRHFDSVPAVLNGRCGGKFIAFGEQLKMMENPTLYDFALSVFNVAKASKAELSLLIQHGFYWHLIKTLKQDFDTLHSYIPTLKDLDETHKAFIVGGLNSVMIEWILADCATPAEQLAESIAKWGKCDFSG